MKQNGYKEASGPPWPPELDDYNAEQLEISYQIAGGSDFSIVEALRGRVAKLEGVLSEFAVVIRR